MSVEQQPLIQKSSGEIMSEKAKRLDDLEREIKHGFRQQAEALTEINDQRLYEVFGFVSIVEYAEVRLDRRKSWVYQMLDCGAVFQCLSGHSAVAEKLTHESLLRPLQGMKPESKVKVLEAAAKEAKDGALSGPFIEDLAKSRFRWKPRDEFIAEQRAERDAKKPESVVRQEAFEAHAKASQRAFGSLLELGNPTDLVERYGSPRNWGPLWDRFCEWYDELRELS